MNQSEYAKHRGVSQQRVSMYIRQGKLKKAVIKRGRIYTIDPVIGDRELERTLDPINYVGRLIKQRLTAVPARIAPLVAVLNDHFECEQTIKKEINQVLEELSKEMLRWKKK